MHDLKQPAAVRLRGMTIAPPIALAPMVGLSHSAFRSLILETGGVGVLYTEMLAARRLPHDSPNHSPLLVRTAEETPLFYQIFTASESHVAPAVARLHLLGAQGIDLNLGCPAPSLKKQGAGATLAGDRRELEKVLRSLRRSTSLPVSVKIRLGDALDLRETRSFCRFLEEQGVDLITIHARLNGEKFCRRPRWAAIGEVKDAVSVPVFANGGIFSVDDARKCLAVSRADGLMIGRGAVENPDLCAEIAKHVYGMNGAAPRCRHEVYFRFVRLLEERFAPERRLGRLKQFTSYYAAPLPFGHHLAAAIQSSGSVEQARQRAERYFKNTEQTGAEVT